ncbi:helix-turn-helix domain-containing protein [Paenibacillus chartarius]|uniref:Helix-turn-helix domain-containing protein n=1 Tax=Paenibacillus chartarius TaxID=747481 RepID=A0ABV6DV83_9BACL
MIGKRIRELREQKRMSLSELAAKADVAKSYLSNMERDIQKNPSIQFIEKIAAALDVSMDLILHGEEQGEAPEELDQQWQELVREAMSSGVTKEQFREFLEFNKWKMNQGSGK